MSELPTVGLVRVLRNNHSAIVPLVLSGGYWAISPTPHRVPLCDYVELWKKFYFCLRRVHGDQTIGYPMDGGTSDIEICLLFVHKVAKPEKGILSLRTFIS